ncbi:MAG: efflux RND transporter periplasmic adaptor subunit [Blastocatellia bacterium]
MSRNTPTDYCAYPPQIAGDVEVSMQQDGDRQVRVVGAASVGRYLMLRETEYRVFQLLGEELPVADVCAAFGERDGATLPPATLIKFIAKLDGAGIIAGQRPVSGAAKKDGEAVRQPYLRFSLFNPDRLFARMVPWLRWVWTPEFVTFTVLLMLSTALLSLVYWPEVSTYGGFVLGEYYGWIFLAALLVVTSHEFAHGLTCKAFGGRATEVGVLLVYYFMPALYCNVSGIHLIEKRSRRLWVIAAGVYWQLLVGAVSLLLWFFIAPHTWLADLAFIVFFGSVLNLVFNANPLIKLDGYYFLSQWLRMPNLMDRSRAWWRGLFRRLFTGTRNEAAAQTWREQATYATFGLFSLLYTIILGAFLVRWVGRFLVDSFYLPGLLLTAGVALLLMRRPLRQISAGLRSSAAYAVQKMRGQNEVMENKVNTAETAGASALVTTGQPSAPATPAASTAIQKAGSQTVAPGGARIPAGETARRPWRRALVPAALLLLVGIVLCLPWQASTGNYGTLVAIPGQESIIRAPESATLVDLRVTPGAKIEAGAVIGRLGNLETDEELSRVQSELARANADYERVVGELRARNETAARAELQLRQRRQDFSEIEAESKQINERRGAENRASQAGSLIASTRPMADRLPDKITTPYPPAFAALHSGVEHARARLEEAQKALERARTLHEQGLMPRSDLDVAETRATTLTSEHQAAREKFDAALIDHRRKHQTVATEMQVAQSDLGAEKVQATNLGAELAAMRGVIRTLEDRRDLMRRKQSQFELISARGGTVFGEDLPRLAGQFFQKGQEICRVANTQQLLLRVLTPEREIGDVTVGQPVRLKARAWPDRTFTGTVSRISAESELDEHNQAVYRVELIIENRENQLRPGMTAFARIDFGRWPIGAILWHKVKQALRPELWMF